jgi:hypothetical protein
VHGSNATFGAFWSPLRAHHADIVVNGHAHVYERFGKQSPSGVADAAGIRQFTAGTGGKSFYTFGTPKANSQVRLTAPGVLRLQLHANSYDWAWHDSPDDHREREPGHHDEGQGHESSSCAAGSEPRASSGSSEPSAFRAP